MNALTTRLILFALLFLSLLTALRGAAGAAQGPRPQQTRSAKIDEGAEGQKRFTTNCGRCHHPPEDLSPREARAVLRQMRVRAMLSAEDERLILKFLAP